MAGVVMTRSDDMLLFHDGDGGKHDRDAARLHKREDFISLYVGEFDEDADGFSKSWRIDIDADTIDPLIEWLLAARQQVKGRES